MYTREVISNFANSLIKALELSRPYDPYLVVDRLGGKVEYDTITDMAIDASIRKKDQDSFIIDLNKNKPFLRERFSIAHEPGHLFLHMGFLTDEKVWNSIPVDDIFQDSVYYRMSGNYTQEENEANEFAASFLMPKNEFVEQIQKHTLNGRVSMLKIADYFDVSTDAAITRAKWLGYVRW